MREVAKKIVLKGKGFRAEVRKRNRKKKRSSRALEAVIYFFSAFLIGLCLAILILCLIWY